MTPVRWAKGYTQGELDSAQHRFGLVFPPDLVALLREKRPVDGHDWRDDAAIRRALDWPLDGLLIAVESGQLWWPEWGTVPSSAHARKQVLREVNLLHRCNLLRCQSEGLFRKRVRRLARPEPALAKSNQIRSVLVRPCRTVCAKSQPSHMRIAFG